MDSVKTLKVRFAPSPTGILHVGGIRTALFNYFLAKSNQGIFVLRNEDTDQARKVEGSLEATMESLTWLGVTWDDLITQSERLSDYSKYAYQLVDQGQARLEEGAVRFIVDKSTPEKISWIDAIGQKEISYDNQNIEDFIILKKDGFPTYHLANVVDDHLMEITHVIRGEDWIPSTPKHLLLYKAFGWQAPVFAHVPNVLGTDGKKLSKRRNAKSVLDFKNDGYLAEALLNYLMLLGWSPKGDREILSKNEIEKEFSLENINSSAAIFDERKLLWMNGEYIRGLEIEDLKNRLVSYDETLKDLDQELLGKLVVPAQTRMKLLSEFKMLIFPFLNDKPLTPVSDQKTLLYDYLNSIISWNRDEILNVLKKFIDETQVKFPKIYEMVIGVKQGLPLPEVFEIIGKEKPLKLLI